MTGLIHEPLFEIEAPVKTTPHRPSTEEIHKCLEDALELIRAGWTQGTEVRTFRSGQQSYCAIGAIRTAARYDRALDRASVSLVRSELLKRGDGDSIVAFNDKGGRTKREVEELFMRSLGLPIKRTIYQRLRRK